MSTASDLARWAAALEGGTVLGRHSLHLMWSAHVRTGGPGGASAGYGWVVGKDRRGKRVFAVGGGTDFGFTSDLRIYPDSGLDTVALSSTDRAPAPSIAHDIAVAFGV